MSRPITSIANKRGSHRLWPSSQLPSLDHLPHSPEGPLNEARNHGLVLLCLLQVLVAALGDVGVLPLVRERQEQLAVGALRDDVLMAAGGADGRERRGACGRRAGLEERREVRDVFREALRRCAGDCGTQDRVRPDKRHGGAESKACRGPSPTTVTKEARGGAVPSYRFSSAPRGARCRPCPG